MKKPALILVFLMTMYRTQSQTVTDSLLIDGHYRTFHFNRPGTSAKNSYLVYILHGSGGNGLNMMKRTQQLEEKAAAENLILVYPNGYKNYWNECRRHAKSAANIENINEEAFFISMGHYFKRLYDVNDKAYFAIGLSGGGHMAYKLALTMPGKFKAISAVVANLPDTNNLDCIGKKVPVAVMITNGTADSTNPYNGGLVSAGSTYLGHVRSTDRTLAYWAELAGYRGKPLEEDVFNRDTTDGQTIKRYTYRKQGKPEVTLLKVIGGKHEFPTDIDCFVESWEFFKRQIMRK